MKSAPLTVTVPASTTNATVNANPQNASVLEKVWLWLTDAGKSIASVLWDFGGGSTQTAGVANGGSAPVSTTYSTPGAKTVNATYLDANGAQVGTGSITINVTNSAVVTLVATITGALSDSGSIQMPVANGDSTSDTTPVLTGTLSMPLNSAQSGSVQNLNIYDGNTRLNPAATVTGQTWVSRPVRLTPGIHTFTARVEVNTVPVAGSRSTPFALTIAAIPVVSDIQPIAVVRGTSYSFNVTGSDLPTNGITVTVPDDARASCQTPNNMTATGFGLVCQFYKMGARTLHVNAGGKELGTVSVSVNSNVTGVSWTSPVPLAPAPLNLGKPSGSR